MPDLTEKTLKRNEVYAGRIIRVRRDEVLLPGGGHGLRLVPEKVDLNRSPGFAPAPDGKGFLLLEHHIVAEDGWGTQIAGKEARRQEQ